MHERELAAHGLARAGRALALDGELGPGGRGVHGAVARGVEPVPARLELARCRLTVSKSAAVDAVDGPAGTALVPGRVARQPGGGGERADQVEHTSVHRRLAARRRRRLHRLAKGRGIVLRPGQKVGERGHRRRALARGPAHDAALCLELLVEDPFDGGDVEGASHGEPVGSVWADVSLDDREASALRDGWRRRERDGTIGEGANRVIGQTLHVADVAEVGFV